MCNTIALNGPREHRCCTEIDKAVEKFGHLDKVTCITQLEDYQDLTKTVVLEHIAPLLKDRQGRSYRQRSEQGRNMYVFSTVVYTIGLQKKQAMISIFLLAKAKRNIFNCIQIKNTSLFILQLVYFFIFYVGI